MNDEQLKKLFDSIDTTADEGARERALSAAMQAFDATRKNPAAAKGTLEPPRPTPETHSLGRRIMNLVAANTPARRWAISGMASAAVLVVGVYVALQIPQHSGFELPGAPPGPVASSESERWKPQGEADGGRAAGGQPTGDLTVSAQRREVADAEIAVRVARTEPAADAAAPAAPEPGAQVAAPPARQAGALEQRAPIAKLNAGGRTLEEAVEIDVAPSPYYQDVGRDQFETAGTNPVKRVATEPVSTFSIDVDTAAYSFVRRELNRGVMPQKAAVRLEEMVNYFPYDYPPPGNREQPFSTDVAVLDSPWKAGNKLVRIGIQGYELQGRQPRANLVFLLDVSGSMNSPDKLPLVRQSMGLLLSSLQPEDTVAIAVYAGAAGTVLEPTPVKEKQKILAALNRLQAGGSTAGAAGIELAYQLAEANFVEDGVNRVVLATDGDFNVGINDRQELKGYVERKRESGVMLSVLGFGQGNYNDALMQALAQNGNGIAAYIDTLGEAQKVLVDEATSALFPIARDVKIQVEFNPATVSEYRLLGYETRALAEEDFNNDAVDAGDIGAGHSVTAIYEITPTDSDSGVFSASRYREAPATGGKSGEYGFLKLRYKLPGEDGSRLISQPIAIGAVADATALREARFAAAVAGFAQLLKGGKYTGDWSYADVIELALANRGEDPYGYRSEFVQLVRKAGTADAM